MCLSIAGVGCIAVEVGLGQRYNFFGCEEPAGSSLLSGAAFGPRYYFIVVILFTFPWQNLRLSNKMHKFATLDHDAMFGQTLKLLREANNFTQENVSDYLGIKRSTYSNYETGDREAPWEVLEKLANLYGCDQYDLESEDQAVLQGVIACAFRVDSLSVEDMKQVAAFKQLVMNYVKMKKIAAK